LHEVAETYAFVLTQVRD